MQKNPFELLEVSESVTQSELYDAYRAKREQYLDKRFAPGDEGAEACARLDEIDAAYREAEAILKERVTVTDLPGDLHYVETLIKNKQYSEAQDCLDKITIRSAEWHFLQSVIYYQKGWTDDSLAQLKVAMNQDPNEPKYKEAYEKLANKQENKKHQRHSFYRDKEEERSYRDTNVDQDSPRRTGCTPCECCQSLLCADCCCECMGGDLISCC